MRFTLFLCRPPQPVEDIDTPAEKPVAPTDGGLGPEPEQGVTAGREASPQHDATADEAAPQRQ